MATRGHELDSVLRVTGQDIESEDWRFARTGTSSRARGNAARRPALDSRSSPTRTRRRCETSKADPHINLAYYDNDSREWFSVSGSPRGSIRDRACGRRGDRALFHGMARLRLERCGHAPSGWLRELTRRTGRSGSTTTAIRANDTADDPSGSRIGADIESAVYLEVDEPKPIACTRSLSDSHRWAHRSPRDTPR